jgi:putative flippase GtrA
MGAPVDRRALRGLAGQGLRFCAVGATNTAVSLVAFWALLAAGLHYVAAAVLAFAAGAVNGYLLNRTWTFHAAGSWRARALYVVVQLLGLGLNAGLVWLFVDAARLAALHAQILALPPVTVLTFTLSRQVVFRAGQSRRRPAARVAALGGG